MLKLPWETRDPSAPQYFAVLDQIYLKILALLANKMAMFLF